MRTLDTPIRTAYSYPTTKLKAAAICADDWTETWSQDRVLAWAGERQFETWRQATSLPSARVIVVNPKAKMGERDAILIPAAAGVGVLGLGCIVGSLFAFGASIGYGFTPVVGVGLVLIGLVAIATAFFVGGRAVERVVAGTR